MLINTEIQNSKENIRFYVAFVYKLKLTANAVIKIQFFFVLFIVGVGVVRFEPPWSVRSEFDVTMT